ncbi:unknown protein [Seminavis robusta]|uniref:Uncharacterized protein n=1 Tax=Seminavis robusta TaxID=568900 RepID=A0A9N8EA37_9STRA|nr:unknown protein [Seminavis robusta]|eukprot:Sro796_g203722.1  (133) ;mRNA; f:18963-19361
MSILRCQKTTTTKSAIIPNFLADTPLVPENEKVPSSPSLEESSSSSLSSGTTFSRPGRYPVVEVRNWSHHDFMFSLTLSAVAEVFNSPHHDFRLSVALSAPVEKFPPKAIFSLPRRMIRLQPVFQTDGSLMR